MSETITTTPLENILSALGTATNLNIKPLFTTTTADCIVYKDYPTSDDGAKSKHSLELRLITSTFSNAESYKDKIIKALVPVGDNIKIDGILACELNGGGSLYEGETKTYHTMMYFNYVIRSKSNG